VWPWSSDLAVLWIAWLLFLLRTPAEHWQNVATAPSSASSRASADAARPTRHDRPGMTDRPRYVAVLMDDDFGTRKIAATSGAAW
jgi:hypothetical protein